MASIFGIAFFDSSETFYVVHRFNIDRTVTLGASSSFRLRAVHVPVHAVNQNQSVSKSLAAMILYLPSTFWTSFIWLGSMISRRRKGTIPQTRQSLIRTRLLSDWRVVEHVEQVPMQCLSVSSWASEDDPSDTHVSDSSMQSGLRTPGPMTYWTWFESHNFS